MNITKYGTSTNCGYGSYKYSDYSWNRGFSTNMDIYAKSRKTSVSKRRLQWSPSKVNTDITPIFVVFDSDSGKWKEYFSGMTIEQARESGYSYDVDCSNIKEYNIVLSMSKPYECSATEFADNISRFTEKDIKEMVAELYKLSEDAPKWGNELKKLIEEVKNERAEKERNLSSVESNLASSFGKYGANSSDNR